MNLEQLQEGRKKWISIWLNISWSFDLRTIRESFKQEKIFTHKLSNPYEMFIISNNR